MVRYSKANFAFCQSIQQLYINQECCNTDVNSDVASPSPLEDVKTMISLLGAADRHALHSHVDEMAKNVTYGPRIAAFLTDLDTDRGAVYFDDSTDSAVISFIDVPCFGDNNALNTFQIELVYSTNEIVISYTELYHEGCDGGLAIGLGNGGGEYTHVDLSVASPPISISTPVESFITDSNPLDLHYTQITFSPTLNSSQYSINTTNSSQLPATYSNNIVLPDDEYVEQDLIGEFDFYGKTWTSIFINNDGNIGFEHGDDNCVCSFCEGGDGVCEAKYLSGALLLKEDDDR